MTRYYVRKTIRRWAFLEPWCAFLRENVRLQLVTDQKSDLLLCVRLRPEPREALDAYLARVVLLREALELLTMIAYVDTLAWQELLRYKCKCVTAPFWDDWALPLGMWLKLGDAKNPELAAHDTVFYRTFFTAFAGDRVVSDAVRLAMQGIICEMTPAMHHDIEQHRKVEVCLRLIPSRSLKPQDVNEYLRCVVGTAKECLATAPNADGVIGPFISKLVLNDVELHIGRIELPPGATAIIAEFMALETQTAGLYPLLDFGLGSALGLLSLTELEPLLQAIARRVSSTNKRVLSDADALPPLESFALVGSGNYERSPKASDFFTQRIKAVFSTLSVSQCFDEIHLDHSIGGAADGTRAKKWQWLAYALFSKDSTTRVTKLTISETGFCQADMNAIISILNARIPASKLGGRYRTARDLERVEARRQERQPPPDEDDFGSDAEFEEEAVAGADDEDPDVRAYYAENPEASAEASAEREKTAPGLVALRKGTTIQIDPVNGERGSSPRESFGLSECATYRVIQDDPESDWVQILVPCYGVCNIPRSSVVRFAPSPDSSSATSLSLGYRGSIKALRLALEREVKVTLFLPLLKYLSSSLLSLETAQDTIVDGSSLRQVFEACPRLKVLRISEPRNETESELIDGYAQGRCSISELRLDDFAPSQGTSDLIRVLQEPSSRAAQTLKKLSLFVDSEFVLGETLLNSILDMLEANTALELLQLKISPDLMKEFKPRFMKFHGQVISGFKKPLQVDCCVAFLSVVRFFSAETEAPPRKRLRPNGPMDMGKLDRGVISLIFQFAADRKTRRIRLHEVDLL
ncbi:hypothetical protein Gpo141_00013817 [Globisporangium polare]